MMVRILQKKEGGGGGETMVIGLKTEEHLREWWHPVGDKGTAAVSLNMHVKVHECIFF